MVAGSASSPTGESTRVAGHATEYNGLAKPLGSHFAGDTRDFRRE